MRSLLLLIGVVLCLSVAQAQVVDPANSIVEYVNQTVRTHDDNHPASRRFVIESRDDLNNPFPSPGLEVVVTAFTSNPSCEAKSDTSECSITCAPMALPNIRSPSCDSFPFDIYNADGPHFVYGTVTHDGGGFFTGEWFPEFVGTYDLSVEGLTQGGLYAQYWDNVWFVGSPVITRIDPSINWQWGTGVITTYGVDYVSARWEGNVKPDYTETYTIYALADDGVRVWMDRQLIIDEWDICCNETWATVNLEAGHYHDLIVEFSELRGEATIELRWSSPSTPREIIPTANLYYRTHLVGSPITGIVVQPGDPMAAWQGDNEPATTATGVGLTDAVAGESAHITLTARDLFGNEHEEEINTPINLVFARADGAPFVPAYQEFHYVSNSTWEGFYNLTAEGFYNMTIEVDGRAIDGSPFFINNIPAATDPSQSIAYGPGLYNSTAGEAGIIYIQPRDRLGNDRYDLSSDEPFVHLYSWMGYAASSEWAVEGTDGFFSTEYTPTIAGDYNTSIYLNGQHIMGSPFKTTVVPGQLHAPTSDANGMGLSSGIAGMISTFTIYARDQFGNLITADSSFEFEGELSNSQETIAINSSYVGTPGEFVVKYIPNLSGEFSLSVRNGTVPISGSPWTVTISPNIAQADQCEVLGGASTIIYASSGKQFVVGATESIIVQAKDLNQNNLETDGATLTATLNCPLSTITATSTYIGSGQYSLEFVPDVADPSCSFNIQHLGAAIKDNALFASSIFVSPATANANMTQIDGTDLYTGTASVVSNLTINARDLRDNELTAGGNRFTVTVEGPESINADVIDNADGTYDVTYTATVSGTYTTTVRLINKYGLRASYYSDKALANLYMERVDATVDFDWGQHSPFWSVDPTFPLDFFSVSWVGEIDFVYSETYRVYVAIASVCGIRVWFDNTLVIDDWDPTDGVAELYFETAVTAGAYYPIRIDFTEYTNMAGIQLMWESPSEVKDVVPTENLHNIYDVANTPVTTIIYPSATLASTSSLFDVPATITTAADTRISIQARDANSNVQTLNGEENKFSGYIEGPSGAQVQAQFSQLAPNGVYVVNVTIEEKGDNYLYVDFDGSPLSNSPMLLSVIPSVIYAPASLPTGTGISSAVAGLTATFQIESRDIFNNTLDTDGSLTNAWSVSAVPSLGSSSVSYDSDGIFNVEYVAYQAGTYTLTVLNDGRHLMGSPYSVTVAAGIADASLTHVEDLGTSYPSAISDHEFKITAVDSYNNVHTDGDELFVVRISDHQGTFYQGIVSDNGNGNYTVAFNNASELSAGDYSMYVSLADGVGSTGAGLTGYYFNNRWLSGDPVMSRVDAYINFDWGNDLITATAKDYVSIYWTGYIKAPATRTWYNFTLDVDDGARLYVDDVLIIDEWLSAAGVYHGRHEWDTMDQLYSIRIEYRENTNSAGIKLYWAPDNSGATPVIVPQAYLFSAATDILNSPFPLTMY